MTMPTPSQRIWLQYLATSDRIVLLRSQNRISKTTKQICRDRGWVDPVSGLITQKGIDVLLEGTRRANAR
jgi:hypothetical protein